MADLPKVVTAESRRPHRRLVRKHARQAPAQRQRAGLLQAGAAGCVSPGRPGAVAPVPHRARHVGRRRAVSEGVDGRAPALNDGVPPPQSPARENPPQLFGGRDGAPVQRPQEHGPQLVQAGPGSQSTASARPWSVAKKFAASLPSAGRARSRPCGPGRIYCLPCRAPKVPAGKMAECVSDGRHHRHASGHLSGLRPDDLPPGQSAEDWTRCAAIWTSRSHKRDHA